MSSTCPFCNIASTNPPIPSNGAEPSADLKSLRQDPDPTVHLILSTEHVMAFLDIMPLTKGHVLVAPRRHFEMLGDMDVQTGQEVSDYLFYMHCGLAPWLSYLLTYDQLIDVKSRSANGFPFFREL